MRGASVRWLALCSDRPTASASSWIAAAVTISVVWRNPR
jgi:hypothetical protein